MPRVTMDIPEKMAEFSRLCTQRGLALTHQRQIIYRALLETYDHPNPEMVYERVRLELPNVSLGTVYKNLKTFLEAGLLREVSVHHEAMRMDANTEPHHHLVCVRCKSIMDIGAGDLDPVVLRRRLPRGFRLQRVNVEIQGLCAACASQASLESSVEG